MTIEQRAKAYEEYYPNMDDSHYSYYVRDGYIKGATDQRKIDIENTCKYLERFNETASVKIDVESWRKFITKAIGE